VSVLAIVNPVAGNGAAARMWDRLRAQSELARHWECATSQRPGHALELARAAADKGYDRVIAIGGDGTISDVGNGLAHSTTVLGIVMAGTGNDIGRNLGIPRDPRAAARLAVSGAARPLDVCEVRTREHTRLVLGVASFGFDAEVAWRANRMPKFGGGTLPYVAGVLQSLWQYRAPPIRLTIDHHVVHKRVFLVAVGNLPSYGGGMRIIPHAQPNDGLLDVCVVKEVSRFEVLRMLPRLYSGGHVGHPAVEMLRCRSISADADGRVLCQSDGELVGDLPAHFAIQPAKLHCAMGPVAG
jgi:diacylglycerol kinase (ATP)